MENNKKQQEYLTNMQLETLSTGMRSYHSYGEYKIIINSDSLFENIVWNNANNRTKYVMQNQVLIQKIINRLKMNDYGLQSSFIKCVTTLHILDPNKSDKMSFCADPYYHKRPWHDWCISNWEIEGSEDSNDDNVNNENNHYPSRIMMIIDTNDMKFNCNITKMGRFLAVVKATELDTRSKRIDPTMIACLFKLLIHTISTTVVRTG